MRAGALRNKVYYRDFVTVRDDIGGTYADYYSCPECIVSQYAQMATLDGYTVESSDCGTNSIATYAVPTYFWASINQKDGGRGLDGAMLELDNYTEIRTRFNGEINKKWLLIFNNRKFTIHSYRVVDERRKEIVIKAVEVK